jgi:hypothetical protein
MYYNARMYDPALGRFAQADTIVPAGVQGLDRYAYVNNSPLNFVDPSGHEPGTMCGKGYYEYCSSHPVIFFGGSDPDDPKEKGPSPYSQSPMWTTDESGDQIPSIQYPGGANAKADQATSAQGIWSDDVVDIIGYSGGTESALMYALWRLDNGQDVDSIALLGPTFLTTQKDFDEPDGGWAAVLDTLLNSGVDIYIFDDGAPWNPNPAFGYSPPSDASGRYEYEMSPMEHYSEHPRWNPGTNNNKLFKQKTYEWMAE